MGLFEDLIAAAGGLNTPISSIVAGPRHFMVTAGSSGVAEIPKGLEKRRQGTDREAIDNTYRQRPLGDLVTLASSADMLQAALGIAALNSAFAGGLRAAGPRSFSIPRAGGKTVAVAGDFDFIEDLRRVAGRVITLERRMQPVDGADSESGREAGLDEAEIAIIAGASIVDGSLGTWLDRTRHCYTVIYGPSTPLSPVLFEYGADQLVGVRITVEDVAAAWIREGRVDLLACPGVASVVIARDREAREQ